MANTFSSGWSQHKQTLLLLPSSHLFLSRIGCSKMLQQCQKCSHSGYFYYFFFSANALPFFLVDLAGHVLRLSWSCTLPLLRKVVARRLRFSAVYWLAVFYAQPSSCRAQAIVSCLPTIAVPLVCFGVSRSLLVLGGGVHSRTHPLFTSWCAF